MTTKRLDDLDLKDMGVKARLEELSGSLGGFIFDHVMRWEGKGRARKLVRHALAAQVSECQMDDTDILAEPRAGEGATLDEAAAALVGHVLEWFEKERKVVAGGKFFKACRNGTGLCAVPLPREALPDVQRDPLGGFARSVVSDGEAYTNGFSPEMAYDLGLYRL